MYVPFPRCEPTLTIENMMLEESAADTSSMDVLDVVFDSMGRDHDEVLLFFAPDGSMSRACEDAARLLGELPGTLDEVKGWAEVAPVSWGERARVDATLRLPNGRLGALTMRALHTSPSERGLLARIVAREPRRLPRVEELLTAMTQGIALLGHDGDVLHVNEAAASWLGIELGGNVADQHARATLFDDTNMELGARDPILVALKRGRETHGAHVCVSEQSIRRCAEMSVSRVGVESTGWLVLLVDVTAQREKEARRDEMLSIASHELRNPLTPLKGFLQIALQQRERDEDIDGSLLRKAEHQVQRLGKLVDGLLDLSRAETGRLVQARERVSLSDIVGEHVSAMGNDRVRLELPDEELRVEGALSSLEQVIGNLLDNALKYSPATEDVEVTLLRRGGLAVLRVKDHGEGMSSEELDRVFERFYRAPSGRAKVGGLGLGLYITRRIVEEHEGTIEVSSELGEWTVVEVSLPVTD